MHLMTAVLARLGSRFALVFQPQAQHVLHSALGRYLDAPARCTVALAAGERVRSLPLGRGLPLFEVMEQEIGPCHVALVGRSWELGLGLRWECLAPFYPQDVPTSILPAFLLRGEVFRVPRIFWTRAAEPSKPVRFLMRLERPHCRLSPWPGEEPGLLLRSSIPRALWREGQPSPPPPNGVDDFSAEEALLGLEGRVRLVEDTLEWECDLDRPETCRFSALWAAYVAEPVLTVLGQPARFLYTRLWASLEEVVRYARAHEEELRRRTACFEETLQQSSLTKSEQDLLAFSLQNFLLNSWWVVREEGEDWFSVWEGSCHYHSTLDVEYNDALFYFALWPELLEKLLDEWPLFEQRSPLGSFLSHDMGWGLEVNGQKYPHPMEVEENCNYLLLLGAYHRWTGREEVLRRHSELARRLTDYLHRSDTTGSGFPTEGVANTLDDASPAVQFARRQTYLGVKALCALAMAADMARALGDGEWEERCLQQARRLREALEREAWLGDHYAVCLDRTTEGLRDAWSGEPLPPGELEGWDAYSLYTSNGTLYPLLVGVELDLDWERLRTDLLQAHRHSLTEYGCTHSSWDRSNVWVSQNLWRDCIAAYLGLPIHDADRYWALQALMNTGGLHKGFIDTSFTNNLCYYPRGVAAIGLLFARIGLQWDGRTRCLRLFPTISAPSRFPLLPFADWGRGLVPWVEYAWEEGRIVRRLEPQEVLQGIRLEDWRGPKDAHRSD